MKSDLQSIINIVNDKQIRRKLNEEKKNKIKKLLKKIFNLGDDDFTEIYLKIQKSIIILSNLIFTNPKEENTVRLIQRRYREIKSKKRIEANRGEGYIKIKVIKLI
jgi:hypothetical protein